MNVLASVAVRHYRFRKGGYRQTDVQRFSSGVELWAWIQSKCDPKRTLSLIGNDAGQLLTLTGFWQRVDSGEWSQRWCAKCGQPAYTDQCCGSKVWRGVHVTTDPPVIVGVRNTLGILRILSASNYWSYEFNLASSANRQLRELEGIALPCIERWAAMDCGCWQPTSAGLSWTSWRHKIPPRSVVVDDTPEQIAIARESYYAGQCEAYWIGSRCEPIYKIDARSFYGGIMRDNLFPVAFSHIDKSPNTQRVVDHSSVLLPIARVRINSQSDTYPVRLDGKLLFARGQFNTTLAGPELLPAIARGHVYKTHSVAWYHAGSPFREWADHWWDERIDANQSKDKQREAFCKTMLAALSGKLAAWSVRWKDLQYPNPPGRWHEWYDRTVTRGVDGRVYAIESKHLRARAGWVQELLPPSEGRDSCPAIAAFITSYGREAMRRIKQICPMESYLYMDTDSLVLTQSGLAAVNGTGGIIGDGIGEFRVESSADSCSIVAQKHYHMGGKRTIAGVKSSATLMPGEGYRQVNRQRLNGILCETPREYTHSSQITIPLTGNISERVVTFSGYTTPVYLTSEH